MVALPRTCPHCGGKMHHYGACQCPKARLDAVERERRALVLRLARLDEIEAEALAAISKFNGTGEAMSDPGEASDGAPRSDIGPKLFGALVRLVGLTGLICVGLAVGAGAAHLLRDRQASTGKRFSVHQGERGGWWAHIEGSACPFGPWRMDRGPYPFRWMAQLEFPIERLTKDGPRSPECK